MRLPGLRQSPAVAAAMVCSGVVTAQFIAGKATRDALYLAYHDITTLPTMVIVTSVVSILLVVGSSKAIPDAGAGRLRAARLRRERRACCWSNGPCFAPRRRSPRS